MTHSLAIIGAGPIGLEAALAALERGFRVSVFERGEVGDSVRRWGHVRMFSPFGMNVSMRGIERLSGNGHHLPDADAILTGREYVAEYLAPLGEALDEHIRTNVEVVSIGRAGVLKCELMGDQARSTSPFRLLLSKGDREWIEHFDLVCDCSGTFRTPNHLGDGGMLAAGERQCRDAITYGVPDVAGRQRAQFRDRRVLVLGGGHSAATTIRDLAALGRNIEVIWITRRRETPPLRRIPLDPLTERDALIQHANHLAEAKVIDFRPGYSVLALENNGREMSVTVVDEWGEREDLQVDRIVAAVGFRPDLELARELQTQTFWATEGTYGLATVLLGNGKSDDDSLATKTYPADSLTHPEPGYFTLGIKSYGRSPGFLIRNGREQVDSLFHWLDRAG